MFSVFKNPKAKKILWLAAIIAVFSVGYYLRAYLSLHHALALSPYEAFKTGSLSNGNIFLDKLASYPLGFFAERTLNPLLGNLYLIYIWGGLVIFFLGRKISGSNLGGFLAFALFAVAPENLLQYTGRIYASGLCYAAIWTALLFFLRYWENKKNLDLLIFILFGVIAIASYHTGAAAFIAILVGLFIAQMFSPKPLGKKIIAAFLLLSALYTCWLMLADFKELELISASIYNLAIEVDWLKIVIILTAGLGLTAFVAVAKNKKIPQWWLWATLTTAAILIFSQIAIFQTLLAIGVPNYYSSAITLNNYLAQIILIHIFFLLMIGDIFKADEPKNLFLRGWLWGLIIIFIGLLLENYYARIIDFSAPLAFIAFGWYLSQKPKFWKTTAAAALILMFVSQIMFYNDPFTMRRYYNQNEIDSVKKIIELRLPGIAISDVRTAALMSYYGDPDVVFGMSSMPRFETVFYNYNNLDEFIKKYSHANGRQKDINVLLSESMKTITYSTNFETVPLTNEVFDFYAKHFPVIYDDGLLKVYRIYQGVKINKCEIK